MTAKCDRCGRLFDPELETLRRRWDDSVSETYGLMLGVPIGAMAGVATGLAWAWFAWGHP